jgi:hypothetical protein
MSAIDDLTGGRRALSFADMGPIWKAAMAWRKYPNDDHECGELLDAIGRLVIAKAAAEREACAKIMDEIVAKYEAQAKIASAMDFGRCLEAVAIATHGAMEIRKRGT